MSIFIQQLLKKGVIDKEKATTLEFETKESGKREEELLIEKGITTEEVLFNLKSENLKIPLKGVAVDEVSLEVLELIPEETAKYYKMIPLAKKDKELQVGMVYPEDLKAQEALKFLSRQNLFIYQVFLITPTTLNNLLKQYRTLRREVGIALEELKTELKEEKIPRTAAEFERLAEEAPITKIVAVILRHAVEGGASDIHIEPTKEKLRIRFRVLGTLHSSILLPLRIHPAVISRIKIMANMDIAERRLPQDGSFRLQVEEKHIDIRVSTYPTMYGEKLVMRLLVREEAFYSSEFELSDLLPTCCDI